MAHVVAIMGAGGAMGLRITRALLTVPEKYELRFIETADAGRQRMAEQFGATATPQEAAVRGVDTVVLATPDRLVGSIAARLVPMLDVGTNLLTLDPAAAHAGRIPPRADVNVFACHPTHPPLYDLLAEESPAARRDFWGGGLAHQALVIAQVWGDAGMYDAVEELAKDMFAPISRSHRITIDQMALLEPAMSESVTNSCVALIKETRDRLIAVGVPEGAAKDFCMGHLQIGIALIFEELNWALSAGAVQAQAQAREVLFKDDWARILEPESVLASTRSITGGEGFPD